MIQQNIRPYNNQTFTVQEAAAWLQELNARTRSSNNGLNSINELAIAVAAIKVILESDDENLKTMQHVVNFITSLKQDLDTLGIGNVAGLAAALAVKLEEETDPTVPQHVKNISAIDISNWTEAFQKNLASGNITGDANKVLTLTHRNGGTISIPFQDLSGAAADGVVNTLYFDTANGVLSATTTGGDTVTANFDGRYSLIGHNHSINNIIGLASSLANKLEQETDPTVPQHVKDISTNDLSNWTEAFQKNLASGNITGDANKVLTLTHRDGNTISIPFEDLGGTAADGVVNTLNFNTANGVLSATTTEGDTVTANFDGRYSLLGHKHNISDIINLASSLSNKLEKGAYTGTAEDLKLLIDNFQGFSGNYNDLSNQPKPKFLTLNAQKEIDVSNPLINYYNWDAPTSEISLNAINVQEGCMSVIRINADTAETPDTVTVNGTITERISVTANWFDNQVMELTILGKENGSIEWWCFTKLR